MRYKSDARLIRQAIRTRMLGGKGGMRLEPAALISLCCSATISGNVAFCRDPSFR